MVHVKLAFLIIMAVLAVVFFVTPMFFPERKGNKNNASKRIRIIVRIRMGCFLGMLILLLLCVIL